MIKIIKESFSYDNLLKHLKHIDQYKDDPRFGDSVKDIATAINNFANFYNAVADSLASKPAGPSTSDIDDIVGYVRHGGEYAKYDKINNDLVVYNPRTKVTITLHKKTWEQYLRQMQNYYEDELPENKL